MIKNTNFGYNYLGFGADSDSLSQKGADHSRAVWKWAGEPAPSENWSSLVIGGGAGSLDDEEQKRLVYKVWAQNTPRYQGVYI